MSVCVCHLFFLLPQKVLESRMLCAVMRATSSPGTMADRFHKRRSVLPPFPLDQFPHFGKKRSQTIPVRVAHGRIHGVFRRKRLVNVFCHRANGARFTSITPAEMRSKVPEFVRRKVLRGCEMQALHSDAQCV